MHLRNSISVKLFAILLFSFELLAPPLMANAADLETATNGSEKSFIIHSTHSSVWSFLLEERSEEEREGKDVSVSSIELYPITNQFVFSIFLAPRQIVPFPKILKFDTRPPLFKLHRIFII